MRVSVSDLTYTVETVAEWADNAEVEIDCGAGGLYPVGRIEMREGKLVIHGARPGYQFQGVSFLTQRSSPMAQGDGDMGVSDETQP